MGNVCIEGKSSDLKKISIETKEGKPSLLIVLLSLGLFCLIFPFSLLFFDELKIGFGYVLTLVIFLGSSAFFTRLFLWNKYGKEIYEIKKDKIIYFYDYKFFKDNRQEFLTESLRIGFFKEKNSNKLIILDPTSEEVNEGCYLAFVSDDDYIKSNIPISYQELKRLANTIFNKN